MTKDAKQGTRPDPRQARLAKALRDNLKRRREQVKRRAQALAEPEGAVDMAVNSPQTPLKEHE